MNVALHSHNVLSLCAGVGGLELGIDLALRAIGGSTRGICYVEREAAAAASLVASMEAGWLHPAPIWSDMLTFDARTWRGLVHILASGDPCQENSVAGKRAGASGSRFLAPEVVRIAADCGPDLIFRENVPGNADGQLEAIVPPLEGLGYRVAAGIFSSSGTGNTMRRERLFIMAERDGNGHGGQYRSVKSESAAGEAQGAWDQWQRLWDVAGGEGAGLGHPAHIGHERAGTSGAGSMDDAHDGGHWREGHTRDQAILADPASRTRFPPAVIPAPNDAAGWRDLLDRHPEYQPALSKEEAESHLRRGAAAMAYRTERLRATGNGVDPLAAATAFLSLRALLAEGRTDAGAAILTAQEAQAA